MDQIAVKGTISIILMSAIGFTILYLINPLLAQNAILIILLTLIVGFINGYRYDEHIKQSFMYLGFLVEVFVLLFSIYSLIDYFNTHNDAGQLLYLLIFIPLTLSLMFGAFIFLLVFYAFALVGKKFKARKSK